MLQTSLTVNDLCDKQKSKKRMKAEIAELSRPERHTITRIHDKNKSNVGVKPTHERKGAVYANWHTPFLWRQVEEAQRVAGWSSRGIQRELQRRDPELFNCISHTTIQAWFDLSNPLAPKWSKACNEMNKLGNHQGEGNKGGRRGVLVRHSLLCSFFRMAYAQAVCLS